MEVPHLVYKVHDEGQVAPAAKRPDAEQHRDGVPERKQVHDTVQDFACWGGWRCGWRAGGRGKRGEGTGSEGGRTVVVVVVGVSEQVHHAYQNLA